MLEMLRAWTSVLARLASNIVIGAIIGMVTWLFVKL